MYLANNTRPDITFAVNLLTRYSAAPTMRYWNGVKDFLRYLQCTLNMSLFYPKNQDMSLIGYANAGYLSDPHNGKSQTGFVFLHGWSFHGNLVNRQSMACLLITLRS
jgi:hypothetical protein